MKQIIIMNKPVKGAIILLPVFATIVGCRRFFAPSNECTLASAAFPSISIVSIFDVAVVGGAEIGIIISIGDIFLGKEWDLRENVGTIVEVFCARLMRLEENHPTDDSFSVDDGFDERGRCGIGIVFGGILTIYGLSQLTLRLFKASGGWKWAAQ